jgi:hypothetical protein
MAKTITYAIGDVHGCFDKLVALLHHCDAHSGNLEPRFVFVGDYAGVARNCRRSTLKPVLRTSDIAAIEVVHAAT